MKVNGPTAKRMLEDALFSHKYREYDYLVVVSDTSEVEPGETRNVLHINDHGNCSLYSIRRRAYRGEKLKLIADCV